MVRMPQMRSSTRNILCSVSSGAIQYHILAHQLKPSFGFKGSATISAMAAARVVDGECTASWRYGEGTHYC
jgi:hypothetical protein